MKTVALVFTGGANIIRDAAPPEWRAIESRGRRGQARMLAEPGDDPALVWLALLGYRVDGMRLDDVALLRAGAGEAPPPDLGIASFRRRTRLSAALVARDAIARGLGLAVGVSAFDPSGALADTVGEIIGEYDLIVCGSSDHLSLLATVEDLMVELDRPTTRPDSGLRLLLLAAAEPARMCPYTFAGAGIALHETADPPLDRGEELLARVLQSFNV